MSNTVSNTEITLVCSTDIVVMILNEDGSLTVTTSETGNVYENESLPVGAVYKIKK